MDWLKQNIGVIVGVSSPLFAVFSFRHINLRRGKLQVSPPRAFEITQALANEHSTPIRFTQKQADIWVRSQGDKAFHAFTNREEDDEL